CHSIFQRNVTEHSGLLLIVSAHKTIMHRNVLLEKAPARIFQQVPKTTTDGSDATASLGAAALVRLVVSRGSQERLLLPVFSPNRRRDCDRRRPDNPQYHRLIVD